MRSFVVLLVFLSSSVCVWAQSTQQGLEAELVHQNFYLLGLWKNDKLHFSADGKLVEPSDQTSPLLSAVEIRKVDLKDNRLELTGQREAIIYQDGKPQTFDFRHTLHIEIKRPDNGDYGPALAAILTPRLADLSAAAPDVWRGFLSHLQPDGVYKARSPRGGAAAAGGSSDGSPSSSSALRKIGGAITAPVVLNAPKPEFSQEARGFRSMPKMDAKVLVYLQVGSDGRTSHVRILQPYGLELDESAAKAVAQYRFKPAMKGDQPVPVEMNVEVLFQKF